MAEGMAVVRDRQVSTPYGSTCLSGTTNTPAFSCDLERVIRIFGKACQITAKGGCIVKKNGHPPANQIAPRPKHL